MNPNIVLVTVDSLRADYCSFMGHKRETTPTLDALAEAGIVFEHAIAPGPITPDSMPATFTGEYPVGTEGSEATELDSRQRQIRRHMHARETLPEKLSRIGYETGAFTPNPWTSRFFGFDQGFDHFEDFMTADISSPIWDRMLEGRGSRTLAATRLVLSWIQRENVFKPWNAFYEDVVSWAHQADDPYFLWVFLLDVHFPYLPADTYRTQSRWRTYEANLRLYLESQRTPYSPRVENQLQTAYQDALRHTDRFFERLRADLDDDTVFVVYGDHGEAFGEHGTYTHQERLYEENIRVPFVVSTGNGERVDDPISLRSLPDVVTGLAANGTVPDTTDLYVTSKTESGERRAVRGDRIKYIQTSSSSVQSELYDLANGEQTSVANEELEQLCSRLVEHSTTAERERERVQRATTEIPTQL